MAAYRRVDGFKSPAGWLPVHRDQLRAQHRKYGRTLTCYIRARTTKRIFYTANKGACLRYAFDLVFIILPIWRIQLLVLKK